MSLTTLLHLSRCVGPVKPVGPVGLALALCLSLLPLFASAQNTPVRPLLSAAMLEQDAAAQMAKVKALIPHAGPEVTDWLTKWKNSEITLVELDDGTRHAVEWTGEPNAEDLRTAIRVDTGAPLAGPDGKPLWLDPADFEAVDTTAALRKGMKEIVDLAALADPVTKKRIQAIRDIGLQQLAEKREALELRRTLETDEEAKVAIEESLAFLLVRHGTPAEKIASCAHLGKAGAIFAQDGLKTLAAEAVAAGQKDVEKAALDALRVIGAHVTRVNTIGTLFRGLSLGSILLVAAIGLAITFGLMGVINMAHGELMAVGAYTAYLVQCVFANGLALSPFGISIKIPGMNASPGWFDVYFVVALPLSFLAAAGVGILLERTVIRFLYRRPLESLLATWGVSLVLQQLFRLVFGSNNVQVSSPTWLSGNWTVSDVIFGWNRVFVICFAGLIVFLTYAALNRTPLGLLIRAVMQNRDMAACMGVRTSRVNMLTFGLGSGLAGLAGAFLSQIGNVGPSLGQTYIIDAFMTVVVGGVGHIMGTVASALGIGLLDQSLQQILGNPVMGKIMVLGGIILFLQWRPSGLFVTRSRSLD